MGASGLGALLVREGLLSEQDRRTIGKTCGQSSWAFAKCVLAMGMLDEDELAAFFAERTKYAVAPRNLLDQLDRDVLDRIDSRMIARLEVLPIRCEQDKLRVAVADPLDKSTLRQIEFFTGLEAQPMIAPLSQIYAGLKRLVPEFKPQFTALSSFLQNHASTAWQRQRIEEEIELDETGLLHDRKSQVLRTNKPASSVDVDNLADESIEDLYDDDLEEEDLSADLEDDDDDQPPPAVGSDDSDDFTDVNHADDLELASDDLAADDDLLGLEGLDDEPPPPRKPMETKSNPLDELDFDDEPPSGAGIADLDELGLDTDLASDEESSSDDELSGLDELAADSEAESADDLAKLMAAESLEEESEIDEEMAVTEAESADDLAGLMAAESLEEESEISADMSATDAESNDELADLMASDSMDEDTGDQEGLSNDELFGVNSDTDADLSDEISADSDLDDLEDELQASDDSNEDILDERPKIEAHKDNFFQELAHQTTNGKPIDEDCEDILDELAGDIGGEPAELEIDEPVFNAETDREVFGDDDLTGDDEPILQTQPQVRLNKKLGQKAAKFEDEKPVYTDLSEEIDHHATTSLSPLNRSAEEVDDELELSAESKFSPLEDEFDDDIPIHDEINDLDPIDIAVSSDTREPVLSSFDEDKITVTEPSIHERPTASSEAVVKPSDHAITQLNQAMFKMSLTLDKNNALAIATKTLDALIPTGFILKIKGANGQAEALWQKTTGAEQLKLSAKNLQSVSKTLQPGRLKKSGEWHNISLPQELALAFGSRKKVRAYSLVQKESSSLTLITGLTETEAKALEAPAKTLMDQLGRKI